MSDRIKIVVLEFGALGVQFKNGPLVRLPNLDYLGISESHRDFHYSTNLEFMGGRDRDGNLIRAATNFAVGSPEVQFVEV